jgi:hypothetical protein
VLVFSNTSHTSIHTSKSFHIIDRGFTGHVDFMAWDPLVLIGVQRGTKTVNVTACGSIFHFSFFARNLSSTYIIFQCRNRNEAR